MAARESSAVAQGKTRGAVDFVSGCNAQEYCCCA